MKDAFPTGRNGKSFGIISVTRDHCFCLPSHAVVDRSLVRERASVSEWPAPGRAARPGSGVGREDSLLPHTSSTQPLPRGARIPELDNTVIATGYVRASTTPRQSLYARPPPGDGDRPWVHPTGSGLPLRPGMCGHTAQVCEQACIVQFGKVRPPWQWLGWERGDRSDSSRPTTSGPGGPYGGRPLGDAGELPHLKIGRPRRGLAMGGHT